jgi:hypothetical protein
MWEGWKRVARKIGDFNARLILSLFYFLILFPFSMMVRLSDPLRLRKNSPGWTEKPASAETPLKRALEQW